MAGLLNNIVPFFGLIILGYIGGKIFRHEENSLLWLNRFIIYAALPPLIFQIIRKAPPEGLLNLPFFMGTTLSTFIIFALTAFTMRWLYQASLTKMGIQGAAASYGNIGYIGLPLCLGIFGKDAAIPAILVFCFDNTLQFVLVPLFNALDNEGPVKVRELVKKIFLKVFLHPFLLATMAGILFLSGDIPMPVPLDKLLTMLERAAGPCALFALGVTVAQQPALRFKMEFSIIILAKVVIHPILTFLILSYIGGFDKTWMGVAVLMAALPTASNVFVMASDYKTYVDGTSNSILISTVISFVTISALLLLFQQDLIPLNLFAK
ncbi:MAG: malonate transporter [Methyloligella sp.]|nr:MAG: malonate transporter [Methyloligella sp.]